MKTYKIVWISKRFGESVVEANSEEEARKLAQDGKDTDFDELDGDDDWAINNIEEIED